MVRDRADDETIRLAGLAAIYLRAHNLMYLEDGVPTLEFEPVLTAVEQPIYDDLVRMARANVTGLTLAEFRAVKPDLAVMRTFRQQTQADFIAKTANQRDRDLFDVANAQTNVIRALLRD